MMGSQFFFASSIVEELSLERFRRGVAALA